MSDKVQGWAWDLDLQPARKLVLLWLAGRATDNGVAFPGEREIRERTGLGERMVRYHLQWLASDREDSGQPKRPLVIRVEGRIASQRNTSNVYILAVPWQEPNAVRRDLEELQHVTKAAIDRALSALRQVGATDCPEVGAAGCRQESSPGKRHRNTPQPPKGAQQQGKDGRAEHERAAVPTAPSTGSDAAAQALVAAFYHGLGVPVDAATPTIRRRELTIAHQLVEAGATPAESEAYAREARATTGRIAPVDLRSFERERLSWLSRARGGGGVPRLVDRTGQGVYGSEPVGPLPTAPTSWSAASRPGDQGTADHRQASAIGTLARSVFGQRP
jgi:hypothetical protein